MWKQHNDHADAIVFVVDASDRAQLPEAREEMDKLAAVINGKVLLILANKHDLPGAMSKDDVIQGLGIGVGFFKLGRCPWFVQTCSVKTGEGVSDGFDWLRVAMASRH